MFEDSTFDSRDILPSKTPQWMLLTLAMNLAIVAAVIVLPLLYPEAMPSQLLRQALYLPAPALNQPRPQTHPATAAMQATRDPFLAPTTTPILIAPSAPADGVPSDQPTDLPMSLSADSMPGAPPATNVFHRPAPPPIVHPAAPKKVTLSTGVTDGLLISRATPVYPAIARATGTSGMVVLAATISASGSVENLRVLSGPALLRQAAIDAVKTWRYRPYLLNSQPVEVETTINVNFMMNR